jgi:gas vesicle protein
MSSPEEIQQEIERTRESLSTNVDRLTDKVTPSHVVQRRVDNVKSKAGSVKERVMGSHDDGSGLRGKAGSAGDTLSSAKSSVGDTVGSAKSSVSDAASTVSDAASSAPQVVTQRTQGNPLAAGLIAFGLGWLLSSLAPAAQAEQNLASKAEDAAKDLSEPLKQKGQEIAQNLKEPLQQSAEQIKSTATEAAQDTAGQAKSAADDVKQPLQQ